MPKGNIEKWIKNIKSFENVKLKEARIADVSGNFYGKKKSQRGKGR